MLTAQLIVQDTPNCINTLKFIKSNLQLYSNFIKITVVKLTSKNINDFKRIGVTRTPSLIIERNVVEGMNEIQTYLNNLVLANTKKAKKTSNSRENDCRDRTDKMNYRSDDFSSYLEQEALSGAEMVNGKISFKDDERDDDDFSTYYGKASAEIDKLRTDKKRYTSRLREPADDDFVNTKTALGEVKNIDNISNISNISNINGMGGNAEVVKNEPRRDKLHKELSGKIENDLQSSLDEEIVDDEDYDLDNYLASSSKLVE